MEKPRAASSACTTLNSNREMKVDGAGEHMQSLGIDRVITISGTESVSDLSSSVLRNGSHGSPGGLPRALLLYEDSHHAECAAEGLALVGRRDGRCVR